MKSTIDEIYHKIAQNMINNTPDDWLEAHLDVECNSEDALGLGGGYKTKDSDFHSFEFRDFNREIYQDFHDLHAITTEGGSNQWNRAKFTLYPSGKFTIDFEWDQEMADEIERLNKEFERQDDE